jgi:hypothetical protein
MPAINAPSSVVRDADSMMIFDEGTPTEASASRIISELARPGIGRRGNPPKLIRSRGLIQ